MFPLSFLPKLEHKKIDISDLINSGYDEKNSHSKYMKKKFGTFVKQVVSENPNEPNVIEIKGKYKADCFKTKQWLERELDEVHHELKKTALPFEDLFLPRTSTMLLQPSMLLKNWSGAEKFPDIEDKFAVDIKSISPASEDSLGRLRITSKFSANHAHHKNVSKGRVDDFYRCVDKAKIVLENCMLASELYPALVFSLACKKLVATQIITLGMIFDPKTKVLLRKFKADHFISNSKGFYLITQGQVKIEPIANSSNEIKDKVLLFTTKEHENALKTCYDALAASSVKIVKDWRKKNGLPENETLELTDDEAEPENPEPAPASEIPTSRRKSRSRTPEKERRRKDRKSRKRDKRSRSKSPDQDQFIKKLVIPRSRSATPCSIPPTPTGSDHEDMGNLAEDVLEQAATNLLSQRETEEMRERDRQIRQAEEERVRQMQREKEEKQRQKQLEQELEKAEKERQNRRNQRETREKERQEQIESQLEQAEKIRLSKKPESLSEIKKMINEIDYKIDKNKFARKKAEKANDYIEMEILDEDTERLHEERKALERQKRDFRSRSRSKDRRRRSRSRSRDRRKRSRSRSKDRRRSRKDRSRSQSKDRSGHKKSKRDRKSSRSKSPERKRKRSKSPKSSTRGNKSRSETPDQLPPAPQMLPKPDQMNFESIDLTALPNPTDMLPPNSGVAMAGLPPPMPSELHFAGSLAAEFSSQILQPTQNLFIPGPGGVSLMPQGQVAAPQHSQQQQYFMPPLEEHYIGIIEQFPEDIASFYKRSFKRQDRVLNFSVIFRHHNEVKVENWRGLRQVFFS